MIAEQTEFACGHDAIDTFARIGPVANDVPETVDFGDTLPADIRQHSFQRFEVRVNIANDGAQHKFLAR